MGVARVHPPGGLHMTVTLRIRAVGPTYQGVTLTAGLWRTKSHQKKPYKKKIFFFFRQFFFSKKQKKKIALSETM